MLEQREIERWQRLTAAMIRKATEDASRPEDGTPDPEAFGQVVRLLANATARLPYACARLREQGGYSWTDIAEAIGISRQAAHQRFGLVRDGAEPKD